MLMKLIIAEKPSVAKGIADVVGAKTNQGAYLEGDEYLVSWCFGHLIGLKPPNDYENSGWAAAWNFGQLPMIPQKWEFKLKTNKGIKEQFLALKKLMARSDVTEIICATDADREGECIFRYVYYFAGCKKRVNRLWLSNLEQSAIRKALNSVKSMSEYDSLFAAGYARAKADWLVGMNGSRLFSLRYGTLLNLGRVQTPTLAMIVKRDFEVDNFVKQKYFTVDLDCGGFTLTSARIDDEQAAETLAANCNGKSALIQSVKRELKNEKPPKLYDLTSLQRDANKTYGYTAKQSLDYTQSLYEKKLVTYPRTDSQYLPDNMAQETLDVLRVCNSRFEFKIEHTPDISRCINNDKVTGHHAIIPTASVQNADLSALSDGEKNVLMLVVTRLICATADNHKYESVKVTAQCCDSEFTASGRTEIAQGWRRYTQAETSEKEKNDKENKPLPNILEGRSYPVVSADKTEHFTSPPKPYTEDTLLSAMERAGNEDYDDETEKKGLGTPATRAGIIEMLVFHGYVERQKKQLRSTDKGKALVEVVPEEIKSVKTTAEWETQLQQIERGQYSANAFINQITAYVVDMCGKYNSADTQSALAQSNAPLGRCPKCSGEIVKGKYGYYCKANCGMKVGSVYGHALTENNIKALLGGKSISYTANGRKTTVLPQIEENVYNGKSGYQWVVEGSNTSSAPAATGDNGAIGKCPKCSGDIIKGKYGYYCKSNCGMKVGSVYGHALTENNIKALLGGKSISYTANGRKTTVLPQIEENTYNGKTNYQWLVDKNSK
ncbi:MAG: DNA topoisomerase 3 [Ruminococcus sp.]|nr:DNA topoisomerase 3 [Ruminococcus sp.]